ncbi:MAG: hypothetical protein J2P24_01305 [Streptosporangiales bacterium]|nr:hypothetical protein [Streptosporangiales bacterium]MBO0891162.1 hypothetical protein [Acidothermales bacterium]
MARPATGPDRRSTAALLVLLCVACLFALGAAAAADSGQHVRTHPAAHAVKDVGKLLPGSGVRGIGNDGGLPATAPFAVTALAVLVLLALRYGRREAGDQQCHTVAASSRGPPGRPVLA